MDCLTWQNLSHSAQQSTPPNLIRLTTHCFCFGLLDIIQKPFYKAGFRIRQQELTGWRQGSLKAPKSPRNQGKQLHSFRKKILSRLSFPSEHFVTVIVTSNLFFSLPVYFVYLTALSVQSIVLPLISKAYLLISPSRYRSHAVLQELDERSSQTCERLQAGSQSKAGLNRQ